MAPHWKLAFLLTMGLMGCEAMKSGIPAINPAMTRAAAANGDSIDTLVDGRRLFASRCISCHTPEPIEKYTSAEWRSNVLRMANRAGLDEAEISRISAYLAAARASL